MDGLLPSEIARLVLGYLEDENCPEVAKMFLESSPFLRECYTIAQRGGEFSRRLQGISLMNILDKFCAINALVQARLSKMEDCESLKGSRDILEQLRFLMDGSRGQRFVVNINVPTQNATQASGGSPIISSSMRKRRHSGPVDRDRSKKVHKSNSPLLDRRSEPNIPQSCDTVETTSLEQLPGHKNSLNTPATTQEDDRRVQCSSTSTEILPLKDNSSEHMEMSTSFPEKSTGNRDLPNDPEASSHTCETGTDTKELMAFTNTEVQTAPCEAFNTASEMMDCPVENLSLLTKELLNRTELQERIAQTINRTLIPAEASLRDSSFTESNSGECNTSIMRELDNAIKSIVIETETDPVFEQFLLETIGQGLEGETSPDEDAANSSNGSERRSSVEVSPDKGPSKDKSPSKNTEIIENNTESNQSLPIDLPSTSSDLPGERDLIALDDVNAEAILSIINVNNTSKEQNQEKILPVPEAALNTILQPEIQVEAIPVDPIDPEIIIDNIIPLQPDPKTRRKRAVKQKRERKCLTPKKRVPECDLVPVPTLIICSQQEIHSMKIPMARPKSQYIPIMPKTSEIPMQPDPTLYLRTVNVLRSKVPEVPSSINVQSIRIPETMSDNPQLANQLDVVPESDTPVNESITLYGTDSGAEAVMNADISSVQLEESMSLTGTGLSPFLKLHPKPAVFSQELIPSANGVVNEDEKKLSSQSNTDILTRRTPRSIMKSRSRNHRLSLSTPRRRSSHIRALDFNTPTKGLNTSRRMSDTDKRCGFSPKSSKDLAKACRTSLFKSPPFGSAASPKKKVRSPSKLCRGKIPIATRSPAPKLIGGWDKITGVGMIIDGASQSSCSTSPEKTSSIKPPSAPEIKRTWDADLRMAVAADVQPVEPNLPKKKGRPVRNRRSSKKEKSAGDEPVVISDDETNGIQITLDTIADSKEKQICSPILEDSLEKCKDESGANNTASTVANEICKPMEMNVIKKVTESMTHTSEIVTEQGVTKKYAKLKTLTTTVTKIKDPRRGKPRTPGESLEKSSEFRRSDSLRLVELETPRKFDPNLVPPTPRVLSPSSSMTTPFAQISENSGKIQSFVSTPEFPPTPSINLTPKQSNDCTMDDKKAEFGSSYYQPSFEVQEVRRKGQVGSAVGMLSSVEDRVLTTTINIQRFQASTSQLEITQFEVIKENLPKEQAIKELKLSRSSECQINKETNVDNAESTIDTPNTISKTLESSGTADDSSESDSDSSSSSSASSSSCSCCNNTNTSSKLSTSRKSRKTPHKVDCSSTNEFTQESPAIVQNLISIAENVQVVNEPVKKSRDSSVEDSSKDNTHSQKHNEKSPIKLVPITKTEEILKAIDLETPAKDEGLLVEADISETPSSSKTGIESLTNLNSKIAAIIKEDFKPHTIKKLGPTIVSVEKLSPAIKLRKLTDEDVENANKSFMDAKLARELDEKRLRMLSKLRSDTAPVKSRSSRSKDRVKSKTTEPDPPTKSQQSKSDNPSKKSDNSQPLRKSMRNAEKRAQRGLSEPTEQMTISEKIAPERKAQSSRDSNGNDDGNLENIILPDINPPINSPIIEDDEAITPAGESESESENKHEESDKKENDDLIVEEKKDVIRHKVKSKVDMVKRDLFSDEENTDGKPTGSKSRRLSDDEKSDSVGSVELKPQNGETGELPGVLESLQLVPTNKSIEETELDGGAYQHIELSFVYDESQPSKKINRRRKLSNSELEMKVIENEDGEIVWKILTATPYEEIFKIAPPRRKPIRAPKQKTSKDKPVTTVVAKKRGKVQLENSKSIAEIKRQPLATSSPVNKEVLPPKVGDKIKAPPKSKADDKVAKPKKRKNSESKDEHVEKKPRTTDPAALLSGLNIDKLLNQVHGADS